MTHISTKVDIYKDMPLHGHYFCKADTLFKTNLSPEWTKFKAITTKYTDMNFYNSYNKDYKCQFSGVFSEKLLYIVSTSSTLAPTKYTWKHINMLYVHLSNFNSLEIRKNKVLL